MRVLLDESLPHDLRALISDHEVFTVQGRGWGGTKNGELLALAESEFDIFVTADRSLRFQQNLSKLNLGVIVLVAHPNRIQELRPLLPQLLDAVESIEAGQILTISG